LEENFIQFCSVPFSKNNGPFSVITKKIMVDIALLSYGQLCLLRKILVTAEKPDKRIGLFKSGKRKGDQHCHQVNGKGEQAYDQ
jgi:hypothetical protein